MPLTPSYPTSLDSLTNPGADTYADDTGFFLDEIIARIQDILELVEARLGVGASNGTPVVNSVYVGNGTGTSQWLAGLTSAYLAGNSVTQRAIVSSATARNTTSASAADIGDMSLTMSTGGGDVLGIFVGSGNSDTLGTINTPGLRLDSGTDRDGATFWCSVAGYGETMIAIYLETSVSAASHTLKARWRTNAGTLSRAGVHMLLMLEIRK